MESVATRNLVCSGSVAVMNNDCRRDYISWPCLGNAYLPGLFVFKFTDRKQEPRLRQGNIFSAFSRYSTLSPQGLTGVSQRFTTCCFHTHRFPTRHIFGYIIWWNRTVTICTFYARYLDSYYLEMISDVSLYLAMSNRTLME